MATKTKKKTSKRRAPKKQTVLENTSDVRDTNYEATPENTSVSRPKRPRFGLIAVTVLVGAVIIALLIRNRSVFLAATVNGAPVTRMELNERLTQRYGTQELEAIIGERLIKSEATKEGATVSQDELNARIAEIEKSLNGQMKLDDALKLQGVSRPEFEEQVRIQLLIDKMLSKEVSVSAQEVDEFIKGNATTLTASDPAEQRVEAEKNIKANKITEKFQTWFTDLKNKSKIDRYISK